jgi:hypothetical protein
MVNELGIFSKLILDHSCKSSQVRQIHDYFGYVEVSITLKACLFLKFHQWNNPGVEHKN